MTHNFIFCNNVLQAFCTSGAEPQNIEWSSQIMKAADLDGRMTFEESSAILVGDVDQGAPGHSTFIFVRLAIFVH